MKETKAQRIARQSLAKAEEAYSKGISSLGRLETDEPVYPQTIAAVRKEILKQLSELDGAEAQNTTDGGDPYRFSMIAGIVLNTCDEQQAMMHCERF